ncbi:MAG: ATP-dependent 6-phosphofructokinase [Candidatus Omnitrophica bacterium]|nr:ATP-dependent 6-phosphofructokinase [Candidatus Omnitrophota bacterium]
MKRIGILTGGGDCPGLNAVIRAVTKAAHQSGYQVLGFQDGYAGLVLNRFMVLTDALVSGILTQGGTILGTSNKANPYRWPVPKRSGTKRARLGDVSKKALAHFKKNRLRGLIVTGGDGTMAIAKKLHDDGVPIVGIPKTIDNDLPGTDITFGFETAVITAADAIDKIHTTAQSHHRVMVVEVMGRYAGWIALYSGAASGGDVILIPEIPYRIEAVCRKIRERARAGKHFTIIVAAEGAKPLGGRWTVQRRVADSTDPIRLGGIASKVAYEVENKTGLEARSIVLGHVQRGGSPTPFDRLLATRFGTAAMRLAESGSFGRMVAYKNNCIESISLEDAAGPIRTVPADHPLLVSARTVGTSFGDLD